MTDKSVNEDLDLTDITALLDDDYVLSIIVATSVEPLSAKELGERCDLSVTSIYRRVDRLRRFDLLKERTRPRCDGHHETVYVSALDRFELTIDEGELDWTVDRTSDDVADELSQMWGDL
ncbi:winged helix-turn-helix domain-containing protein [Halopiger goleimassiliensis]|uniref:winged helix-turn-helix domain-containing protein n=1 Tax=Halopiger goleimassiliensis TaxID=1293048 RepID=UPI0006779620